MSKEKPKPISEEKYFVKFGRSQDLEEQVLYEGFRTKYQFETFKKLSKHPCFNYSCTNEPFYPVGRKSGLSIQDQSQMTVFFFFMDVLCSMVIGPDKIVSIDTPCPLQELHDFFEFPFESE